MQELLLLADLDICIVWASGWSLFVGDLSKRRPCLRDVSRESETSTFALQQANRRKEKVS